MDAEVTVVIPLYNKARVIDRAIRSVVEQTFRRWHLIVVDDGSTDEGAARVTKFLDDPRVRLVRQDNAGPGAARNAGLALTKTRYVAFLDADDEWDADFLDSTLHVLEEHPSLAVVAAAWRYGAERTDSRLRLAAKAIPLGPWSLDTAEPAIHVKARVDAIHSSAALARTEVVRGLGGFYAAHRCTYGEDSWLWARLILHGHRIYLLNYLALTFHTDESSLSVGRGAPYPLPPLVEHWEQALADLPASRRALAAAYIRRYCQFVAWGSLRQRSFRVAAQALMRANAARVSR